MNDILKEYMETGRSVDQIHKEKVKNIHNQWFLIVVLLFVILGGYCGIVTKRNVDLTNKVNNLKDSVLIKNYALKKQYEALDSAVYFGEIKK